jgi:phenylacetate-CoA ligase
MEINSETLFVEILDDKGAVLPYGKGRIVITSLFNKAHPFIHDIGDIGILDESKDPFCSN